MDAIDYTRFFFAFILVLGLIGLSALLAKKYLGSQKFLGLQPGGRLTVVETRYLDSRRKLMLVRRDGVEHLILLADGRELVVESGIVHKSGTHA